MKTFIMERLDNWADNKSQQEFNKMMASIGGAIMIGLLILSAVIDTI